MLPWQLAEIKIFFCVIYFISVIMLKMYMVLFLVNYNNQTQPSENCLEQSKCSSFTLNKRMQREQQKHMLFVLKQHSTTHSLRRGEEHLKASVTPHTHTEEQEQWLWSGGWYKGRALWIGVMCSLTLGH